MKNQAFTIIELLIAVLIIGILAAIAVPQYKVAVGKSQYIAMKPIVKLLYESNTRYYLSNGTFPKKFADLDIDLPIEQENDLTTYFIIKLKNIDCYIMPQFNMYCAREIFGTTMMYHIIGSQRKCVSYNPNENYFANRICQQETGQKYGSCSDFRCIYEYP